MIPQQIGPYVAGQTVSFEVEVNLPDGTDADLTAITAHFRMARPDAPSELVVSTEFSPPTAEATAVIESPPTAGIVVVDIEPEVTESLLGTYEWIVDLEDAHNDRTPVARGYVTFNRKLG